MTSRENTPPRRPEVLAPAGDPLAFRAAIAAGADAVYLGMARFNARGRAERFRGVTLAGCVRAAHDHGVRVYVTLNTLIHEDEVTTALDLAAEALRAGADAAIVQDLGLAALLREDVPGLALHGSTQMTIHGPEQAAEAVERLGLRRIIAARECSVEETAAIAERIRPLGAGIESFVHGALCFAYSGQCLMSNFAGRRSANRGICAQNCRFDFTAGETAPARSGFLPLPVFDRRGATQLISMKDLAAFDSVAALADAGVESFKIEGRLKGPEYVAEVTRLYRAALDAWEEGRPFAVAEAERAAGRVYSRGFTNGYLAGRVDPSMRGDKRSLEGEPDLVVVSANRKTGAVVVEPRAGHEVRAGQGYRYAHDRYRGGFRVTAVKEQSGGRAVAIVRFGAEASGRRHRRGAAGRRRPPPPLPAGLACYLNDDPELSARIERLVAGVEVPLGPAEVSVRFIVSGVAGEPLRVKAIAADGRAAEAVSAEPLEAARARSAGAELLAEHLGRFGGTAYRLESLDASGLSEGVFASFPVLHALRRRIVEDLDRAGSPPAVRAPAPRPPRKSPEPRSGAVHTELAVVVGDPGSLGAALRAGAGRTIVEASRLPRDPGAMRSAWGSVLEALETPWFRLPPIVHGRDADRALIERIRAAFPGAGIVAGHLGQLALARGAGMNAAADLHLNAQNRRALEVLHAAGARRVTLDLEVDAREAARVAASAPEGVEVEVVIGGEVFSMLTRQPYGLAGGERLLAVSEHGHAYRFEASEGITTLFEARELVGAEALALLAGRVHAVRLDLAHQRAEAVGEIAGAYRAAIDRFLEEPDGAAARGAVEAAAEIHRRHAPAGAFTGHLIRGSRLLDTAGERP